MITDLFRKYLTEPPTLAYQGKGPEDAVRYGIKLGEPVFGFVAELVEGNEVALLERLYSGSTRLHKVIWDDLDFRDDAGFARRAGAPFRDDDNAAVHAVRALAGLGLALTGDVPAEGPLRSALAWYTDARGSLTTHTWDPRDIDWGQPRLPPLMKLLAGAAGEQSSAGAALTTAVTLHALAAKPATRGAQATITVLLVQGDKGARARLRMSIAKGLPPGLVPDPRQMALFSADPAFQQSLDRAWSQAGSRRVGGTVLWSVKEGQLPSPCINGESAGAAFAADLDEIRRFSRPLAMLRIIRRLRDSNAIVGRIDDLGYLQHVEGYDGKLSVLGEESRVIVPVADAGNAGQAVGNREIIPAAHWKKAAGKARRSSRKVIFGQGLAVFLVAAVLATLVALQQNSNANAQGRASLSHNLAALAVANLATHLNIAQLLAVEATQIDNDPQARAALYQAVRASPHLERFIDVGTRVTAIAASADGNVIVAGTSTGDLVRYDLADGRRTRAAAGDRPIADVVVSADGTTVAAGNGTQAFSWIPAGGHSPKLLSVSGSAASVAVSPSGQLVAALSAVDTASPVLTVWNIVSGAKVKAAVSAGGNLAFTSDTTLISNDFDGSSQQYASADLRLLSQRPGGGTPANGYSYGESPDGAISGYMKYGEIAAWHTTSSSTGTQPLSGSGPSSPASYLTFSDDGTLAASIENGTITVSPLTSPSAPTTLTGAVNTSAVSFLGGDDRLVSAAGNTLALWDLQEETQAGGPTNIPVPAMQVVSGAATLSTSSDGRYLAMADPNRVPNGANVSPNGQTKPVVSLYRNEPAVSRVGQWEQPGDPVWSGDRLLLVSETASAIQVARPGGQVLASWPYRSGPLHGEALLASSVGGTEILIPDGTGVILYDPKTMTSTFHPVQLAGLPHLSFTYVAAISPDGTGALLMSSSGSSQSVIYASLRSGGFHVVESGQIGSALFAGNHLLVQYGGAVQEWNATGQQLLKTLPASGTTTYGLTASPGGTMLAQVGNNGVASVTDLATGEVLESFTLPMSASPANVPAGITTMAFSPDGQYLLTATPGDVLSRWDIGEATLVKIACGRAGQSLTPAIWDTYVQGPMPSTRACAGANTSLAEGPPPSPAAASAAPSALSTTAPGPSPIPGGYLGRVAVVSATDAWAVGNIGSKTGLIMHWDGQTWRQVPTPAGVRNVNGIAALSARDSWAVGYDSTGKAVILHWNGAAWTIAMTLGTDTNLTNVSALSASDIWAVGSSASGGLTVHWSGSAWQQVPISTPSNFSFTGITVISTDDAWAVGGTASGSPEIEHWNGIKWQQVSGPKLPGYSGLNAVASVSANDIWAVGGYGNRSVIEHWNGSAWLRVPSSPATGNLGDVTAIGSDDAWAVGSSGGTPLILHWNGQAWGQVSSPSSRVQHLLNGVAAYSPQDAWAVGISGSYPLILHWNGTRWM